MKDLPLAEAIPEINPGQMNMLKAYFRDDALLRETILRFAMVRHGILYYDTIVDMWQNDPAFHSLVETSISFYNSKQSERMK